MTSLESLGTGKRIVNNSAEIDTFVTGRFSNLVFPNYPLCFYDSPCYAVNPFVDDRLAEASLRRSPQKCC